jgi:hypothetical protein
MLAKAWTLDLIHSSRSELLLSEPVRYLGG